MNTARNFPDASVRRLYLLTAIFLVWLAIICLRLFYLQVIAYGDFVQRAQRQQQRTIEVSPRRGMIYDRHGRELAMTISVDSIFAVPNEVPDHMAAANLLGKVLQRDPRELLSKLKSSRSFAWIERKVDAPTSERVRALKLRGIYFQKEAKRYYPKRELAAQVLGYVGVDDEGLGGIERAYDQQLRGRPGRMLISIDARRRWFGRVERQPEAGQNIVLTIDEKIQYIAERELERAVRETRAEAGTIIVQNPGTGEILALANSPTFNPNRFREATAEVLKNRAVSDIYEPGSTFKVVTIAAALEERLTRPDEVIDCQNGAIYIGRHRIRDHHPYGLLTVTEVMANSSGVGAIKLGLRAGEERLAQYVRAFGFGSKTGIELPGETAGLTKPVDRWSKISIGAVSMGQEVGVSALQLLGMTNTIANDGMHVPPRIIAGVTQPNTQLQRVTFRPAEQRRVISAKTAHQLKKMLEAVVLNGTGKKAILDGYTAAGKTGTAQKTDPNTGAYHPWKHVASFAGFAPVRNPSISVLVILDSARGLHQGGQIAAPVFQRVAQQALTYLNVPYDVEVQNPRRLQLRASARDSELDEGTPDRVAEAVASAEESRLVTKTADVKPASRLVKMSSAISQGSPALQKQISRPIASLSPKGTVLVDVGGGVEVPSFIGKSLRAAVETAQQAGFELSVSGSGVARSQAPAPGSRIRPGARVVVHFAR